MNQVKNYSDALISLRVHYEQQSYFSRTCHIIVVVL